MEEHKIPDFTLAQKNKKVSGRRQRSKTEAKGGEKVST